MSSGGYKKNIGLVGSVSLLVTSITGPGMVLIPYVFQTAGWVTPTLAFIIFGALAGISSLFVIEASSRFPGNDVFQRNVEFTVMVHQFYGRNWYYLFIVILYGSLQSVNVASIVGSAQAFDSVFVGLFGASCG
jgi:amino acid permease